MGGCQVAKAGQLCVQDVCLFMQAFCVAMRCEGSELPGHRVLSQMPR